MKKSKAAVERRLQAERRAAVASERKEPLRRRLLIALGRGPARPTSLSAAVGARKESVSRKLVELRRAGLVSVAKDSDDLRHAIYSLTREGRSELGRYLAFGKTEEAPSPPSSNEIVAFLREALAAAVAMRRRSNRLQEAIDRIQEIYEQAEEARAHDVALEALAELATTQRQARQHKERSRSLAILETTAMGAPGVEPQLVFPAIAQLEYERGKASDLGPADPAALSRHLIASMSLFEQLVEKFPRRDTRHWRSRRAWSVISLAQNFRDQSRYEDSLRYAASGLRMFQELDDDYGRAQCWYLFGFCLRLLRRFDAAWNCLEHARDIATAQGNSYERAMAYYLVQMGEVRRCQGKAGEAKQLLSEALDAAQRLDLHVAQAFATSALAAVEFQQKDLERAQGTLRSAQQEFTRCKHQEGIALNARRQITVARHLSEVDVKPDDREVKDLIDLAEETYWSLGSPAGVAACEIERGRMRMISPECGDLDEVVEQLGELIRDERETLEQDPWVPKVLRNFAREVGGPIAKEAREVYSDAERRLMERGDQGVQQISELANIDEAGESHPSTRVIEMGGESRRREAPLALAA
jgi:tetratricopeptide (TPR) repeat protein